MENKEEKTFITIGKLYEILSNYINDDNKDCIVEMWVDSKWGEFLLDTQINIGHFSIIPDMTFGFKLTDYMEEEIEKQIISNIKKEDI